MSAARERNMKACYNTGKQRNRKHAFTMKGTCDHAGGLAVFMDIRSMRELFGQEEDYYNMLLSDKALSIDKDSLYSVAARGVEKQRIVY